MGRRTATPVGLRVRDLDPLVVDPALRRFPRLARREHFCAVLRDEARSYPGSRAAFYQRWVAVERRVRRAPFSQ